MLFRSYALYGEDGALLYWSYQTDQMDGPDELPLLKENVCLRARVPLEILNLGDYRLELISSLHCRQWITQPRARAPMIDMSLVGLAYPSSYCLSRRPGSLAVTHLWSCSN